jgi:hypothetical protein
MTATNLHPVERHFADSIDIRLLYRVILMYNKLAHEHMLVYIVVKPPLSLTTMLVLLMSKST